MSDIDVISCDVCGGEFFSAAFGEGGGATAECVSDARCIDDELHIFVRCPWCSKRHPVTEGGSA